MCPPASIPPVVELDECSTDETVIQALMQIKSGHTLPSTVLSDVDPYQCKPSNLPPGMWYFWSGSKMDAKIGFWRSTGEACEIYKTSSIIGLRKTLQFYEGPAHDGQKTNWIMQEYTTNEKYTSKLVLDDCLSRGDYLSMDDLSGSVSPTTSFGDSSCMTRIMTAEELFDSDALLRELDDDIVDQEMQDSNINLNLSAPAEIKQVVMQPTTLGSLDSVNESKPRTGQNSETNPTIENKSTSNEVETSPPPPPTPPSPPPPASSPTRPPASSPTRPPSSSSSSEGSSKEEKKGRANVTKKRKIMKYLCFLAF